MALSRQLRRYRGWIAAGVLVAVVAVAYVAFAQTSDDDTAGVTYTTEQVTLGTISVTVSGTGNVTIDGTTDVWPLSAGTVDEVHVVEGAEVTTGTALFTLDAASAEAETARALASYRQAQQSVLQAESQLLKAENALDSLRDQLAASSSTPASGTPTAAVTDSDIEQAEKDIEVAEAGLASAQASRDAAATAYEQAKAAENDLVVTAPCSGVIHSIGIAAGDSVTAGASTSSGGSAITSTQVGASTTTATGASSSAPVVIAPEQPLVVQLTVNEVDLPSLEVGQRADIEFDALPDLTATGKVIEVADEGTNTQGVVTFDVWISLDVADDALRPQMSAAATIVTSVAHDVLIVPNAAVKTDGDGGYYVEVLDAGASEPRRVTVEIGLTNATETQIVSGLAEGDAVVTQTLDGETESDSSGGIMMPGMGGGPRG